MGDFVYDVDRIEDLLKFYEQIYTIEKDNNKSNNSNNDKEEIKKNISESDFFDKQQTIHIKKESLNLNEQEENTHNLIIGNEPKNIRYKHISRKLLKKNDQTSKNKMKTSESMDRMNKKSNEEDKADDKSILYEDFCLVIKEKDSEKLEISKKKKASLNLF